MTGGKEIDLRMGVRCKVSYLIANFSNEAMEGMSESLETRSVFDLS
jgi:hypothetical protein